MSVFKPEHYTNNNTMIELYNVGHAFAEAYVDQSNPNDEIRKDAAGKLDDLRDRYFCLSRKEHPEFSTNDRILERLIDKIIILKMLEYASQTNYHHPIKMANLKTNILTLKKVLDLSKLFSLGMTPFTFEECVKKFDSFREFFVELKVNGKSILINDK